MITLKKEKEFSKVYQKGHKKHTKYVIIIFLKNNLNEKRFGFVASKKTGNAVKRNRIKRLFREVVRLNYNKFKENNIVFNFPRKEKQVIYSGEKYCFTGSGPCGRKELISLLESKGYEFVDVSKADFLVCEDVNGNSSKLKRAKQKGIKLISYEEFMEKMK